MAEHDDHADITEILNLHGLALDTCAWKLFGRIIKEQIEPTVPRIRRDAAPDGAAGAGSPESLTPGSTPPKTGD